MKNVTHFTLDCSVSFRMAGDSRKHTNACLDRRGDCANLDYDSGTATKPQTTFIQFSWSRLRRWNRRVWRASPSAFAVSACAASRCAREQVRPNIVGTGSSRERAAGIQDHPRAACPQSVSANATIVPPLGLPLLPPPADITTYCRPPAM